MDIDSCFHKIVFLLAVFFCIQCQTKTGVVEIKNPVDASSEHPTNARYEFSPKGQWQVDQKLRLTEKQMLRFRVCNSRFIQEKNPCLAFEPKAKQLSWQNALVMSMASHLVYNSIALKDGKRSSRSKEVTVKIAKLWGFLDYVPIENKKSDTQIALLVHEDFVLIAFRGTESKRDWANNMNLFRHRPQVFDLLGKTQKIWAHRGFSQGAEAVLMEIEDQLDVVQKRLGRELPPLWLAGHSMGGALAAIVGSMLHTRKASYTDELHHFPYGIYTFGMPKVGSIELRDTIDRMVPNFYRFVMDQDVVVTLPIQRRIFNFDQRKTQEFTWPGSPVFLSNVDCETEDSWYYDNNELQLIRVLFRDRQALNDHKLSSYIQCIHKNLHTERTAQTSLFD